MKQRFFGGLWFVLLGLYPLLVQAESRAAFPSYYSLLDFNFASPGAHATAVSAYANPALYTMLPGSELQYFWSDEGAKFKAINRWGLFLGAKNIGLGIVHNRMVPTPEGFAKVTDYRVGFAMGDKKASIGFGYGWSGGDKDSAGRRSFVQFGAIRRFGRYVSMGITGSFSTSADLRSGLADIALRPLGDGKLTVFADMEMDKDMRLKDSRWSAGASIELLPGLEIIGRYFDDESFTVSTAFSFGGAQASASSRFDKDSDLDYTLYGIRLGYPDDNVIDEYVLKDDYYLSMNLKGNIRYRKYRLFDERKTFYDILSSLDEARKDGKVKGVALNLSGAKLSRAKAWEIREKLKELKREGKHVVIFIDEVGMTIYHLASVADKIVLDPDGGLMLPGFVAGKTYLSNLLEKLGLGFDEWRFFKYKSAFESISRESMSDADREQYLAYIKDLYKTSKHDIVSSRNLTPSQFDKYVNEEIYFLPDSALALDLVDKLGRWEDVKKVIEELEGSKKKYMSPSHLAGRKFPSELWGEDPKVAIVYGLGVCAMDEGINARKLEKIFHKLRDDKNVKAVVFRVDSPGGDAMASDVVAAALEKCAKKKPVIVSQGAVAGSGGYWISMHGDTILACPSTVTGSIGVIGGWVWNKGFGDKIGLTSDHVQVGDHADLGFGIRLPFTGIQVPDRNLTLDERDIVKNYILIFYDEFIRKVAKGRSMREDDVRRIAQGRIWSGLAGKENGLVDGIGGLDVAIKMAREAAGIPVKERVSIVELPRMGLLDLSFLKKMSPWPFSAASSDGEGYENYEETFLRAIIKSEGRPLYMVPPEALYGIE